MNRLSVLILAAGKGTRMKNPDSPKVLSLLNGKPLIKYVLDTATALNPSNIDLIVGFQRQLVENYVLNEYLAADGNSAAANIGFVVQSEQLGTGHAVIQAKPNYSGLGNSDILILSGDVPFIRKSTLDIFIDLHKKQDADLSVLSVEADNPFGYGRIIRDASGEFLSIVEEKDAGEEQKTIQEINSGIYFANSSLLFDAIAKTGSNNAQSEYYLTDIVEIIKREGGKVVASNIADFDEIQGVNTVEQLIQLENSISIFS